ncbi:MAG: copper resistance protein B [Rhodothermales bacterium]
MNKYLECAYWTVVTALLVAGVAAPPSASAQIPDDKPYVFFLFDQLEYAPQPSERPIGLEAIGWFGGDINRAWIRAEGEQSTREGLNGEGEAEIEALYGRLVTPYFDAVAGVRTDVRWGRDDARRGFLAAGMQGLAPYLFEVEPTLYVSHEGDVSAEFTASYNVLFTQRLILEPEVEARAAVQSVPDWGVGSGVNDVELGVRLRYEFHRKFAPYVGYTQRWMFGETADLARGDGEDPNDGAVVFGVRLWR